MRLSIVPKQFAMIFCRLLLLSSIFLNICFEKVFGGETNPEPIKQWSLEKVDEKRLKVFGSISTASGVENNSLVFNGRSVIELKESTAFNPSDKGFSVGVWFNPYELRRRDQQMIVAKNSYSQNQRQWGILIEPNGQLRAYLRDGKWKTIAAKSQLQVGRWHFALLAVQKDKADFYLNGKSAGTIELTNPLPSTTASISVGGSLDNGRKRQMFYGAVDEVRFFSKALTSQNVAKFYKPVSEVHKIPSPPKRIALWDENYKLKAAAELPELKNVEFHVIKKWDKPKDGYTFLHGVSLAWHKGKLYASFGHNKGAENTVGEEAQYKVSEDGGKTWGPLKVIDPGEEKNLAISHGVFLSHAGRLWAFHGAYYNKMESIHTRAYSLDESTGQWIKHGVVIENGFWPMNQPVKMEDGNWIMPGGSFARYSNKRVFPAAISISKGNDFTKWNFVAIPVSNEITQMWGESSLFLDGSKVTNIARFGGAANALVGTSQNYGQTWTASEISNLPMATSKPASGVLSTGQKYLVCTTTNDSGGRRTPLTIAVSKPGKSLFSRVFVIRRSRHKGKPGESATRLSLSYPCAIEHQGKLYVGYSNNGGRRANLNSAELAIIPIEQLKVD